jgi:hypothetical protein
MCNARTIIKEPHLPRKMSEGKRAQDADIRCLDRPEWCPSNHDRHKETKLSYLQPHDELFRLQCEFGQNDIGWKILQNHCDSNKDRAPDCAVRVEA